MRCKCCTDENSDIDDIDEIANKCVQQLNAIEEAVNEQEQIEQPSTSKVRNHCIASFEIYQINLFNFFFIFSQNLYKPSQSMFNEPKPTTSKAAYEEPNTSGALDAPINLSPCTETTEKSSIEMKQAEDKPLVIF